PFLRGRETGTRLVLTPTRNGYAASIDTSRRAVAASAAFHDRRGERRRGTAATSFSRTMAAALSRRRRSTPSVGRAEPAGAGYASPIGIIVFSGAKLPTEVIP